MTVTTMAPPARGDAVVMSGGADPARLVEDADAGEPTDLAVELTGVADVGKEIDR